MNGYPGVGWGASGDWQPPYHNPDYYGRQNFDEPAFNPHPQIHWDEYLNDQEYHAGLAQQQIQDRIQEQQIASLYSAPVTPAAPQPDPAPTAPPKPKPAPLKVAPERTAPKTIAKPTPPASPAPRPSSGGLVLLGALAVIAVVIFVVIKLVGSVSDTPAQQPPLSPIAVPTQAVLACESGTGNAICGGTTPVPDQRYGSESGLYLSVHGVTYDMMAHLCSMGYSDAFFINGQLTGQSTCRNLNQSPYLSLGWRANPAAAGTWRYDWELVDSQGKAVLSSSYTTMVG